MFGFSRKEMNKSCQNVLFQLCQTMKSAPIYADIDTSISAFSEGIIRIHQEKNGSYRIYDPFFNRNLLHSSLIY